MDQFVLHAVQEQTERERYTALLDRVDRELSSSAPRVHREMDALHTDVLCVNDLYLHRMLEEKKGRVTCKRLRSQLNQTGCDASYDSLYSVAKSVVEEHQKRVQKKEDEQKQREAREARKREREQKRKADEQARAEREKRREFKDKLRKLEESV